MCCSRWPGTRSALPAENAAIKNNTAPAKWTYANIEHMREQLKSLGYAIDWSREFATCRPEYYVHEQRMFVRLFKKGLVYRKNSVVNWDPVDQTVLANEQVIDGRGWRSGAIVEKREIPQWFLKITAYAQELLDGLDKLPGWPDSVKTMQRNWIGRSEGLEIQFRRGRRGRSADAYSRRGRTRLMGVTFLSIAAEHPLALKAASTNPQIQAFIDECRHGGTAEAEIETQEKKGIDTGFHAMHPITGEKLPVWIANFVLMGYGTGAVMAVPGHDRARLGIRDQVRPAHQDGHRQRRGARCDRRTRPRRRRQSRSDDGGARRESCRSTSSRHPARWHWCRTSSARSSRTARTPSTAGWSTPANTMAWTIAARSTRSPKRFEREGKGARRVNFRLRDWGVSRQRYWGCPIPIVYCAKCDAVPVPEDQLPVVLPENVQVHGRAVADQGRSRMAQDHLPAVRRSGRARDRHVRHLHGVELVLRALHQPRRRAT